jgi:hypothetical protein
MWSPCKWGYPFGRAVCMTTPNSEGIVDPVRWLMALLAVACITGCTGCTGRTGGPAARPSATARAPDTQASTQAEEINALLARPLELPSVQAGQPCPVTPAQDHSPVAQPADARGPGAGPLYPINLYLGEDAVVQLREQTPDPDGLYEIKVVWASAGGGYQGPVVVRVGRIDGPGRGRVRLYYDPAAARGDAVVFVVGAVPEDFPSGTYVTGPGCYAYRLDGRTFTQVIVFRVVG